MRKEIIKILQNLHPETDFKSVDDFIDSGLLDSFDIVQIISDLEENFNISVSALDLLPENFKNIDSIEKLVKKYLKG